MGLTALRLMSLYQAEHLCMLIRKYIMSINQHDYSNDYLNKFYSQKNILPCHLVIFYCSSIILVSLLSNKMFPYICCVYIQYTYKCVDVTQYVYQSQCLIKVHNTYLMYSLPCSYNEWANLYARHRPQLFHPQPRLYLCLYDSTSATT